MTETIDRLRAALAGRYDVSKEIGQGGMATVFLGHDLKHDRDVAIKVLHPDLGAALGSERFLSEIKTTAKLQHPHILPLLDSGEADSLLYYVMPYVVGESLRARIDRERQLPIPEAVRLTQEVANALDYAHRHGVIHRDIKPENILIHDKQALVADFGIALAVSAAGGGRLTQTGLSLGTPQYMSPEQAVGERTIDARSDIYSLGAVTYEMITGDPPFAGNSVQAVVAKIMTERPTPISRLRETVPETVEDAVMIALAKLPADRFATAADFAAALTSPTSGMTTARTAPRTPGRRRIDAIAQRFGIPAIAVALIAIALAVWGWTRPLPQARTIRSEIVFDSTNALAGGWSRAAISPDGSTLVFAGGPQGSLFVRHRDELTATRLAGTDGAIAPFFSPDGGQIGYTTIDFVLKTVPVKGGSPTIITDSLVSRAGSSWGVDGLIYVPNRDNKFIVRLSPSPGSIPTAVTKLYDDQGESNQRFPELLPNGKGVIFTVFYDGKNKSGSAIAVEDLSTHKHAVLVAGSGARYSASGHLVYASETGTLMAIPFDQDKLKITGEPIAIAQSIHVGIVGSNDVSVSRNGTLVYAGGGVINNSVPYWVSRAGKEQIIDSSWKGTFHYPALSPDGTRLAVAAGGATGSDIWIKQLDKGPSLKLTFEGTINNYPTWTPDGRSITYYSNARSATHVEDIWQKPADGSAQATRILHQPRQLAEALWSHDGKWLIFRTSVNVPGGGDIYAIRPGVDTAPMPLVTTKFTEESPTLSPDDRFLAYSSNESGHEEVYVVPFPNAGSAKWPISAQGGIEPLWSHHGNELFYRDATGNLISVSVKTSPTFSPGPATVLFSANAYLWFIARREYDISPDDKRFVMMRESGQRSPDRLIVVDNWFEELKGKR